MSVLDREANECLLHCRYCVLWHPAGNAYLLGGCLWWPLVLHSLYRSWDGSCFQEVCQETKMRGSSGASLFIKASFRYSVLYCACNFTIEETLFPPSAQRQSAVKVVQGEGDHLNNCTRP